MGVFYTLIGGWNQKKFPQTFQILLFRSSAIILPAKILEKLTFSCHWKMLMSTLCHSVWVQTFCYVAQEHSKPSILQCWMELLQSQKQIPLHKNPVDFWASGHQWLSIESIKVPNFQLTDSNKEDRRADDYLSLY